ncbi:DEHA2C01738p [Debaryomyces hansenii CBS767]|uniref:DEHA2C01738p n=1 Tax=Debaryomyces hansenii (strain ATCC 36239 / CBS 767 / BCRC 21394 / JCM 1990 / NBRC 0083 / IGC 2968) TaxID=284592 RepID=B5RT60_DEBHA|nr:DEHA2C01738p [Debaryomyces hansenii CBS767]CAR65522.1 DEHA2C01738p [Debaryomyces hansenii CBS767]|eukprot:XP_002770155.1 DEHA2C01738p [Debaryomyces hansenii CBS767]
MNSPMLRDYGVVGYTQPLLRVNGLKYIVCRARLSLIACKS